jgi:hypothetical protein
VKQSPNVVTLELSLKVSYTLSLHQINLNQITYGSHFLDGDRWGKTCLATDFKINPQFFFKSVLCGKSDGPV